MDPTEIEKKVSAAAKMLNLGDYIDRKPGQLSRGQKEFLIESSYLICFLPYNYSGNLRGICGKAI